MKGRHRGSGETKSNRTQSKLWTSALTRGPRPHARPEPGGPRMQDLDPTLGRIVVPEAPQVVSGRAPLRRTLGSELTSELCPGSLQAGGGAGGLVTGGRAVWPPQSPVLSAFVPALRSWWPAPDLHVHWGLWRVVKGQTNGGVGTPGRGVSCDIWSRTTKAGRGGPGRECLGNWDRRLSPSSQHPDQPFPCDLRSPGTPSLPQAAGA